MSNSKCFYLGLDVSKGYTDFIMLDANKQPVEAPFQLDDNKKGHEKFYLWIKEQLEKGEKIIASIENTGGYEQNWVNLLKKLSKKYDLLEVYKLNPKAVKHQLQSLLKRTVNDSVSAEGIAIYTANNYDQLQSNWESSTNKDQKSSEAQQLFRMILSQIKQQTSEKNQLEKLVYKAFPELLVYCRNSFPDWALRLLEQYATANKVSTATTKEITRIKGINAKKAKRIKEKAEQSVGSQNGHLTEVMIGQHCRNILSKNNTITQLKEQLVKHYENSDMEILKSIKGIGDWTAAAILLQLGDYNEFKNTNQLAAFYGVHPSFKESGDGRYQVKMDKQGNAQMRSILYNAANNVVLHEPYFKSLYAHYKSKGKENKSIMGIIMHKLLRMAFGMLKSQTEFNPKVDQNNQQKSEQNKAEAQNPNKQKRRYQDLNTESPISRSQYKKRRAAVEHQLEKTNSPVSSSNSPTQT